MAIGRGVFGGAALSEEVAATAARVRQSVVQVRAGASGVGSGVIWRTETPDADGTSEATIVTNAHVIRAAGGARAFGVRLPDGREVEATLAAVDVEHDLASLRIRATELEAAEVGDSQRLRVGAAVIAVGNPYGMEGAVTVGVVAARAPIDPDLAVAPAEGNSRTEQRAPRMGTRGDFRRWTGDVDLIQADIRLAPGNSGGPLTDARGHVVGINAMIGDGLALAIPGWAVERFLEAAQTAGTRAYLGVQALTAPLPEALRARFQLPQPTAALVAVVNEDAPAARAGMLVGDVVLALDGIAVSSAEQLVHLLNRAQGDRFAPRALTLLRGGERVEISLEPEARAA